MAIHTIPIEDAHAGQPFKHEEQTTCPCGPKVAFEDGEMLVLHNALDGREAVEWAEEIINGETP